MARVFIGLGSNLASPQQQISHALDAMAELADTELTRRSSLYASAPMGPADQPDYVNAVAELNTSLSPQQLLAALQQIEQQQGRVRNGTRWGPRTLDLDILLYDDLQISSQNLTIPHYGLTQREFVVYPLAELQPDLTLPGGQTLAAVLQQCAPNGLTKLSE